MSGFEPPEHLVILQTQNWVDTVLPGYFMLGARMPINDLSRMPPEALAKLGTVLREAPNIGACNLAPAINPAVRP